jgi:hypothetical protein
LSLAEEKVMVTSCRNRLGESCKDRFSYPRVVVKGTGGTAPIEYPPVKFKEGGKKIAGLNELTPGFLQREA